MLLFGSRRDLSVHVPNHIHRIPDLSTFQNDWLRPDNVKILVAGDTPLLRISFTSAWICEMLPATTRSPALMPLLTSTLRSL